MSRVVPQDKEMQIPIFKGNGEDPNALLCFVGLYSRGCVAVSVNNNLVRKHLVGYGVDYE